MDTPAISAAVGVVVLLDEHWDELDADFRHHYGLDLEQCCWGPRAIGVRRLKSYISRLPPTSALAVAMGWSWDELREMTATLVDLVANQRRTKKSDPVFRYPRPKGLTGVTTQKPVLTREGMRAALMGSQRR